MTHALPVILRMQGLSLSQIGGFGLLMLPWAIKFLWAPWVDRIGNYRYWILSTQLLIVVLLFSIAFLPTCWLFPVLFFVNVLVATQDIATDGWAVKSLKNGSQHWGNTFQVIGSRLGFIVGGGGVLAILDFFEWKTTFLGLAVLVLLNTIPTFFYKPNFTHSKTIKKTWFVTLPFAWWAVLLSFKWEQCKKPLWLIWGFLYLILAFTLQRWELLLH